MPLRDGSLNDRRTAPTSAVTRKAALLTIHLLMGPDVEPPRPRDRCPLQSHAHARFARFLHPIDEPRAGGRRGRGKRRASARRKRGASRRDASEARGPDGDAARELEAVTVNGHGRRDDIR